MAKQNLEGNRFYTYALLRGDTGDVFYIGYGQRDRSEAHTNAQNLAQKNYKVYLIKKLLREGLPVIAVRLREGLTRPEARADEKVLIASLGRYPNGPLLNATAGGDGPYDFSQEQLAERGAKLRGRHRSDETRLKLSKSLTGRKLTAEHVINMAAGHRGIKHKINPGTVAARAERARQLGFAGRGRVKTPEHRAKLAAALTGRKRPPEVGAKVSAKNKGKKRSPEAIEKNRQAHLGRTVSEETRAKLSVASTGKPSSLKGKTRRWAGAKWINNGTSETRIHGTIPEGWVSGRLRKVFLVRDIPSQLSLHPLID